MILFRKLQQKEENETALKFPKFLRRYEALKQRIAKWLQLQFEKLSRKSKTYTLVLFCVLCSIISISIIVNAAQLKEQKSSLVNIKQLHHSLKERQLYLQADSIIFKDEYRRVVQFKNYLFSLKQDSAGRKEYDSIITARPHLIDSIYLLEEMYLHQ